MSGLTTSGLSEHPGEDDPVVQDPTVPTGPDLNSDSWRAEVAARLERYRTRRKPRTPRYPSLLLPFDSTESWSRPSSPSGASALMAAAVRAEPDFDPLPLAGPEANHLQHFPEPQPVAPQPGAPVFYPHPEPSAKVIAFPRSAAIPVYQLSTLADPVFDFDRPRIVEAPEILPPPPALGGMLMEPLPPPSAERRPDSLFASRPATLARRAQAVLIDGAIVATSLIAFAAVLVRMNPNQIHLRGQLPLFAGALGVVGVLFWSAYKFLFIVYAGSTPGLQLARLRLVRFDGSLLTRRQRRWRVLASFLSAFSAGLGYLWCALDQDRLCWHDRITRSHLSPR
jgi:uncharacterized RDD family membrane protein YckC